MATLGAVIDQFLTPTPSGGRKKAAKRGKRATPLPEIDTEVPPDTSAIVNWIKYPRDFHIDVDPTRYQNVLNVRPGWQRVQPTPQLRIRLLKHQELSLQAMLELERTRYIRFWRLGHGPERQGFQEARLETTAGVLREPLGSGKTFLILSLCTLNPEIPKVKDISTPPELGRDRYMYGGPRNNQYVWKGCQTEWRVVYPRYFPVTLIFVAKSVIGQWSDDIAENTDLRTYVVGDVRDLIAFYRIVHGRDAKGRQLADYDVVLVKNGVITGEFNAPELLGSVLEGVKSRPIITVFAELFPGVRWKRVVLDDYDTLGVPANARVIPAEFTWFVSSTKKQVNTRERRTHECYDPLQALNDWRPTYLDIRHNQLLFTFLSIANEKEYVNESCGASPVYFQAAVFVNPNEQVIAAVQAGGTQEDIEFGELLNADATQTAGKRAGIKSSSPVDIFRKLLSNKLDDYHHRIRVAGYLGTVREYYDALAPLANFPQRKPLRHEHLEVVRKNLEHPGPLSGFKTVVKCQEISVETRLREVDIENNKAKDKCSASITRVKERMSDGMCPILCTPLASSEGVVILRCCSVVMSAEAATASLHARTTKDGGVEGSCPACRTYISAEDIILIDKDLDLSTIINQKLESIVTTDEVEAIESTEVAEEDVIPGPGMVRAPGSFSAKSITLQAEDLVSHNKYNYIVCLIQKTREQLRAEYGENLRLDLQVEIPEMLRGTHDKGEAGPADRKVLIYANHGEQMDIIKRKMEAADISFSEFKGDGRTLHKLARKYNLPNEHPNSISVLLIEGVTYCAGRNFQVTTDIVYMHKVTDRAVEAQVGGRAARVGRTCNLHVHYLLYTNEWHSFVHQHPQTAAAAAPPAPTVGALVNGDGE